MVYLKLSPTISDKTGISRAISDYLGIYRVLSTKVQVEAGENNLLQFETFSLFYYFVLHERVLEELALLKIKQNNPLLSWAKHSKAGIEI